MSIKRQVEDTFGLDAFRAALTPQEGAFNRRATVIMNDPKDLSWKPGRRGDEVIEKIAAGVHNLCARNGKGQFCKAEKEDAPEPRAVSTD